MRYTLLITALILAAPAWAHKPAFSDGGHGTPENSWRIKDIDVSIVLYHPVTCDAPIVWLHYDTPEPTELFVQLGVPQIDRLSDYQPVLGVMHSEAPPGEGQPFAIPEGLGIELFKPSDDKEIFFEPFTQTASWILLERRIQVPAGRGYVAAWHPEGQTGKLWVATGETEQFGSEDWAEAPTWFSGARYFHEIGDGPKMPDEQQCGWNQGDGTASAEGCSTGVSSLWLLLGLGTLRRRR